MSAVGLSKYTLGWVGMGRMGYPMAERLAKAGADLAVWNRTLFGIKLIGAEALFKQCSCLR